jgi:hypothetical protein
MNIHRVVKDEELFTRILHDLVAKMFYEECNIHRLSRFVSGGQGEVILFLVGEQDLETPTVGSQGGLLPHQHDSLT